MTQGQAKFTPSIFQEKIFDWVQQSNPDSRVAIINAVAGAGKSTTLKEACNLVDSRSSILFVAFMSRNIADIKVGLPANADAKTLNSIGNRAWARFVGQFKLEVNKDLSYQLIYELIDQESGQLVANLQNRLAESYRSKYGVGVDYEKYRRLLSGDFTEEVRDINRLSALAKGGGMVPDAIIQKTSRRYNSFLDDTSAVWTSLIEAYDLTLNFPDVAIEVARHVLVRSIEMADREIDFDSQLWLPVIHGARFDQYDWVLVDELQDLNAIQLEIVFHCMKPTSRAIGVGDRNQAIYFWRGSLSNTMDVFKDRYEAQEFPLSICYRCAQNIVIHAAEIVPHIEYHPGQIQGEVRSATHYGPGMFGKEDIILCRNSAPLVSLAYRLFRCKKACRILGKDIELGMVKLIKRCSGKSKDIDTMTSRMKQMQEGEFQRARASKNFAKADSLKDRIEAIMVFVEELSEESRTVKNLIDKINKVFKMEELNKTQLLSLSTGHKAKGGEWNNVFILAASLMPSKRAISEEAIRQEYNLMYVMRTRAKKTLTYIELGDFDEECKEGKFRAVSSKENNDKIMETCKS